MNTDAPSAGRFRKFVLASPAPMAVEMRSEQLKLSVHKSIKRVSGTYFDAKSRIVFQTLILVSGIS